MMQPGLGLIGAEQAGEGDAAEAAAAIAFLGSRAASYITGAQLEVSGGLSRHI